VSVRDIEDIYELSPLQQGMLLHSLHGDADTYLAQRSYDIEGPLDADALLEAWQQALSAHTALRTSFHWDGLDKPVQVVHRNVSVPMRRHDWCDVDDEGQRARFDRLLAEDRAAGFDPAQPPLLRLHLIRLGDGRHGFIWTHHMLLLDGWSVPIVTNDVLRRYVSLTAGGSPPATAAPFRDYIAWLQRQDLDAAKRFWTGALSDHAGAGQLGGLLPADLDHTGPVDERVVSLPASVADGLRDVAARHQVTLSTLLQAAWALVLQRHSGDAKVTFGCASSGRPAELSGVDRMVGAFINTLPVCVAVPDDGDLGPWLRDIQARYTRARRYEYSPLAQIKKWAGASGPQPLFHSVLVLDNYPSTVLLGALAQRLSFRQVNAFEKTSEPLTLLVTPEPEPTMRLLFHRERFAPGSVDDIMDSFRGTLIGLVGAQRIASVAGSARLDGGAVRRPDGGTVPRLDGGGRGEVRYADADKTLAELIERQARTTPDAVAVRTDDGVLSYGQLLSASRQVAAALDAAGVGPGDVVGVCAERSPDMVAGLVGTLLAGAAYLPLDPSLPTSRLAFMVSEAGAGVVLAQRDFAGVAAEAGAGRVLTLGDLASAPGGRDRAAVTGADAAYVMYTSGSTGRPKGIVITHRAIVNRLLWMQETFRLGRADRVLQKTPFGFDVSVWEFFWPLMTGATMVLARPGGHQDSAYLAATIARQGITTAHFVPSMLQLFLDEPAASGRTALRRVICSGEQLTYALAQRLRTLLPHVELHNLYGPTEAAVDVTWWDCRRPGPPGVLPIGHAIANTRAYVLDRRLAEAPVDVPGELFLGGVQLARGYLDRPALTAARFIAHPLADPGGRLYRTGDRVRRLPDGSLEFLGRLDQQVKVHGYRIELGEVEQVLGGHPCVREAVVVARDGPDGPRLAAYVTGATPHDAVVLRDYLRLHLPRWMLPATITTLPALPLTHNGKVDRAALPEPSPTPPADRPRAVPATPREEAVAAVYREILGVAEVDATASFFDLGGDSFAAVRAVRQIEGATVGLLAAHPSVRELAAALQPSAAADGILLRLTPPGPVSHTLVCVPFGGGSAIGYQPLARALPPQVALLAASLPGHELGGDSELRPLEEVAEECVDEVLKVADGPVSVYGHCLGVALAVEVVRRLEAADRPVDRLFLGGSYPFYERGPIGRALQRRRAGTAADHAKMRYLKSLGGFDGMVDDAELAFVMRAFRHDDAAARRYFSERWPRGGGTPPLAAPITFVAGTDDPETPRYRRRYGAWRRFGAAVELAAVPGGGHYFPQHQPEALAEIIGRAVSVQ
jgi:amino acid adenylation domain-containing protein